MLSGNSIYKFILFTCYLLTFNQLSVAQNGKSFLSLESNIVGANVYLNTKLLGKTPIYEIPVSPGSHELMLIYPEEKSWNQSVYKESISVHDGDFIKRYIELDYIFIINSTPSNAEVYHNDSLLGTTPLAFYTKIKEPLIKIAKHQYESSLLKLDGTSSYYEVYLVKKSQETSKADYIKLPHLRTEVYLAGGGAVVFGATAALLKVKADQHYKNYRNTGDSNELSKVKKFDKLSGISLFLCEISNALLIYLLLMR